MEKLLIIGASVLQLPAIQKAKEMGLYVGVIDFNPYAIGIPYADEYFNVSTIDEKGVCEVATKFEADGIMTLATDMPMRSIAYTCEKLGLAGINYATAIKSTDKGEMIRTFKEHKVAHPWYFEPNPNHFPDKKEITFPCIIKPVDSSGSRGVVLVSKLEELIVAMKYSSEQSKNGKVIIEEFLQGPEISVEVMVIDGIPNIIQITDKLTTGPPHFVEMGHSQRSLLPVAIIENITELAKKATLAVGIMNGPAHVEIIVTKRGPTMVELGARMGGDCITTHLVPLSTGIDMVEGAIRLSLGQKPEISKKYDKGSAIRYFDVAPGRISKIEGLDEVGKLNDIRKIIFTKKIGDYCGEVRNSADRVGFVIAQSDTPEEAINTCEKAIKSIRIKTE